jgi:pterin-4a-carbinolamine dehydratase
MEWRISGDRLEKTYCFSNFLNAFVFMTEVSSMAVRTDHRFSLENKKHLVSVGILGLKEGEESLQLKDFAEEIDRIFENSRK